MPRHWGHSRREPTSCQGLSELDVATGSGKVPVLPYEQHAHSMLTVPSDQG